MARQLTAARFQPAEFRRVVYRAIVEHGTTFEEVLDPLYFVNVATGLNPLDLIECHWEDCSAFALLHVIHVDRSTVRVAKLLHVSHEAGEAPAAVADEFEIEFTGEHHKFRVLRKSDRSELKTDLPTKGAAKAWLADYKKALTR